MKMSLTEATTREQEVSTPTTVAERPAGKFPAEALTTADNASTEATETQEQTPVDESAPKSTIATPPRPTNSPTIDWQTIEDHMRLLDGKQTLQRDIEYVSRCRLAPPDDEGSSFFKAPSEEPLEEEVRGVMQTVTQFARRLGPARAGNVIHGIDLAYLDEKEAKLAYARDAYICRYLAERVQRVIVVVASKGGAGKTTLISLLSVVYAWLTGVATLLIEGNENGGTANLRTGLSRSNVTTKLADAILDPSLVDTHKKGGKLNLGMHWQSSLHVLLSDSNNTKNLFSLEAVLRLLDVVCEQYYAIFGDTGNGMGFTKTANTGMLLRGHAVLLPVVARDYQTYNELLITMINMYNEKHLAKLQKFSRIVLNGTSEGDTIEQFIDKLFAIATEMTDGKGEASERTEWKNNPTQLLRDLGFAYDEATKKFTGEKIFMVPFSQWIADGKPISVLPEDIGQDTLAAALKILLECLTMEVQTDDEIASETDRLVKMEKAAEAKKFADELARKDQEKIAQLSDQDAAYLAFIRTYPSPEAALLGMAQLNEQRAEQYEEELADCATESSE